MLLQRFGRRDGVGFADAFPGLRHETRIAGHEMLLWVVVRKVERRERILLSVSWEIGCGLGGCRLEWCKLRRPGSVDVIGAYASSYLVQFGLLVLLIGLEGADGMMAVLSVAAAVIVLDSWDKACKESHCIRMHMTYETSTMIPRSTVVLYDSMIPRSMVVSWDVAGSNCACLVVILYDRM